MSTDSKAGTPEGAAAAANTGASESDARAARGGPVVVGTIRPQSLAKYRALPVEERSADLVEARLDLALAGDALAPVELDPFLAELARTQADGIPVLATIRLIADGGRWKDDADRLPWFEKLLPSVSAVDIELGSVIAPDVLALAHQLGRRVIVSHHDFSGTPELGALTELVEQAAAMGADVIKIATLVSGVEDHEPLLDLVRAQRRRAIAVVGMGETGTSLRSYLPCIGSRLTYGFLDQTAAPGQLHARELVARLLSDLPEYRTAREARQRIGLLPFNLF